MRRVAWIAARALPITLCVMAGLGPAAGAAPLAPSLTLDSTFSPPTGIAVDGTANKTDVPGGVAVDGDRIYTVGESDGNVTIVARRPSGALDSGFAGDGRLDIVLTPDRDTGVAILVLPDHRLRVLASTDTNPSTSAANIDVALIGLNADGTDDMTFGGGDGRVIFPVATAEDTPSKMAVDSAGRLAIVGWAKDANGKENTFVALRAPDGSPVTSFGQSGPSDLDGLRVFDRGGGNLNDRGVDIAFRPGGGLLALLQVATSADTTINNYVPVLHALTDTGADDPAFSGDGDLVLAVGDPASAPSNGAVILYGGRWWVTGATKVGTDTDAFLARLQQDGSGMEFRRFDMRGGRIPVTEPILSNGIDLAVLPGSPDTLVVVGSITYQSRPYFAAAAFNNLSAGVAQLGYDDMLIVLGENENGPLVGVSAGNGYLAVTGSIVNFSNFDTSFATARLLVDADKRCDLAIDVPDQLEVTFEGNRPASLNMRVTNAGSRPCAGTISVPPPYGLRLGARSGGLATGTLAPGASVTTGMADVTYSGPRKRDDVLRVQVGSSADANAENNTSLVGVVFSYCDLSLEREGGSGLAPNEGSRSFEFTIRNGGTSVCRRARLGVGAGVHPRRATDPFKLAGGRSASEEISAVPAGRRRIGRRARMVFRAAADGDVERANDSKVLSPMIVGVGDTDARRPTSRARRLSGRATAGRGPVSKRRLRVRRVHVAVRRLGPGCHWLTSHSGRFRKGRCGRPVWLRAHGTRRWHFTLPGGLPPGRYELRSRATIAAGLREASFSSRDRNRVVFRVP
jgi:hypothetical protein